MSKAKIFVIYHHPNPPLIDEFYQPICVGPNKDFFPQEFIRDDKGENIADKNKTYNELTAVYWVYKHLDEFKDTEYIGFAHYRRLFAFNKPRYSAYVKKNLDKSYISLSDSKIDAYFKEFGFVAPCPTTNNTVRNHYEKSHNKEDMDIILDLIKNEKPEFYDAAVSYLDGFQEYLYNMFVMKKDDFVKYCEFIFPIIESFLKVKEVDRLFISERLTGIYLTYLKQKGLEALHMPILYIRKKDFKASRNERKQIKKNYQGSGYFYKNKSMLLYFMPRCVEQYLRRKITK